MPGGGKTGGSAGKGTDGGHKPAREPGKGELETGRRDASLEGGDLAGGSAGGQIPTRKAAGKAPPAPRLPGEKAVRQTGATVPVAPPEPSPAEQAPIPAPAVDQRRQIAGTDEP